MVLDLVVLGSCVHSVAALFDDQSTSWPASYGNSNCDCTCQQNNARYTASLEANAPNSLPINAADGNILEHVRPRFWYAALISCDVKINANYKVTFLQEDGGQVSLVPVTLICGILLLTYDCAASSLGELQRPRPLRPVSCLFLCVGSCTCRPALGIALAVAYPYIPSHCQTVHLVPNLLVADGHVLNDSLGCVPWQW